jgi:acyl-CoA thioesterase I
MNQKRKRILVFVVASLAIAVSLIALFSGILSEQSADLDLSRVACLGDSITQASGYSDHLQTRLGNSSVVGNFGVSGATVNFMTYMPFYFEPAFENAKLFEPTIVIIMLGTNDARTDYYQQINRFIEDYIELINDIQVLESKPKIFLVKPPPIFDNMLHLNGTDFREGVIPRIEQVAESLGLQVIDVYTALVNHPEYFPDGIHPNSEGAQIIADTIYSAVTSNSP